MVKIEGKRRLAAEYRFRVEHLQPDVRVQVWEMLDENVRHRYEYSQSHFIYHPGLMGPYMTSRTMGDSIEELFEDCQNGFRMFYREDASLVPNEHF